jgi:L-lactate dehydrogenase (cytochrome)
MYGVGALGSKGGTHTIALLKRELRQVLEQLCCENPSDLSDFLAK